MNTSLLCICCVQQIIMGAIVTILKPLSVKKRLTKKQKAFRELILNGPVMTPEQISFYEKRHPWLKKITD